MVFNGASYNISFTAVKEIKDTIERYNREIAVTEYMQVSLTIGVESYFKQKEFVRYFAEHITEFLLKKERELATRRYKAYVKTGFDCC